MIPSRIGAAVAVALLTVAVRLYPVLELGNHGPDFENYRQMGAATLRGDDVYATHPLFPYAPYSQVIPALCVGLADTIGLPFQVLLKLVNLAGDTLLAAVLVLALWGRAGPRSAVVWSLAFALNPVSVLVSSFHGNLMELVPVFVGLALAAGEASRDAAPRARASLVAAAAILLGVAVALRSFPLLLIPAFAFWLASTARGRAAFAALALAPAAFSAVPYLLWSRPDFLKEVLSYSGAADIGWLAALRGIPLLLRDLKLFSFGAGLLGPSKALFLLAWAVSVAALPILGPRGCRRAALLPPLLFVGLYGGVAAQYLVWGIPIAVVSQDRWLAAYSLLATAAMGAHYVAFHPAILLATPPATPVEGPLSHAVLVLANGALAAFCCVWSVRIVREESGAASPAARRLLASGALLAALILAVLVARGAAEVARALSVVVVPAPARGGVPGS